MSESMVKQRMEAVRQILGTLERHAHELPDSRSMTVAAVQDLSTALEDLFSAIEELQEDIQQRQQIEDMLRRDDHDARLTELFAAQTAIALENAKLYEAQQEQYRRLQDSQARLIQSEKMSALGRLTASIAHEINNPLQAIQGCLTLVREGLAEDIIGFESHAAMLHDLDVASSEVTRIAAIMQRLREFYRPARADVQVSDVTGVLDAVLLLTAGQLLQSHVALERVSADEPGTPLLARSNADQLKQVFLNLVLNAIEALPDGGTLRIASRLDVLVKQGKLQPAVRIDFTDTGKGIPPETLMRVFEPFFTTKESGSGLGLSISYELVESFGGELTATSQVGQGTTFIVRLPLESRT